MTRKLYDYIFSGLMIILSIYVFFTANNFPKTDISEGFGPGVYPMILAVVIFICAIFVLANAILDKKEDAKIKDLSLNSLKKPFALWICLVLFCVLLKPLGLIVDSILYLMLTMKLLFNVKLPKALLISLGVSLSIWAVFVFAMNVPFPTGTIWTLFGLGA